MVLSSRYLTTNNNMAGKKLNTITLQGKEYAQVATRLKEFREQCPNGSIETKPTIMEDGVIMFITTIVKDLRDEHSARATGSALGKQGDTKAFEKLETISVGRALALLGYAASGEIASGEEMQEFLAFKDEKVQKAIAQLQTATSADQLKQIFMSLGNLKAYPEVIATKDEMKKSFTAATEEKPKASNIKKKTPKAKVEDDGSVPLEALPPELKP